VLFVLNIKAFRAEQLMVPNDTEENKSKNRSMELVKIK
jgi:flagellar motor protein MotB